MTIKEAQIQMPDGTIKVAQIDVPDEVSPVQAAVSNIGATMGTTANLAGAGDVQEAAINKKVPGVAKFQQAAETVNPTIPQIHEAKQAVEGMIPGSGLPSKIAKGAIEYGVPEKLLDVGVAGAGIPDIGANVVKNAAVPLYREASSVVENLVKNFADLSPKRQLLVGDQAVSALKNAKNVMYEHYADLVNTGVKKAIEENPNAAVEITEPMMALRQNIADGKIDKIALNALKRHIPDFDSLLNSEAEHTYLPIKDADSVITRLNAIGGKGGSIKQPIRDLSQSFMDATAEVVPEIKQAKGEYSIFQDRLSEAEKAIGKSGSGATQPFQTAQAKRGVVETVGLGNPLALRDMLAYQNTAKNINTLKTIVNPIRWFKKGITGY